MTEYIRKTKPAQKYNPPDSFQGMFIPRKIWLSKHLTPQEKFLIMEIDSLTITEIGYCEMGTQYFSEFLCVTKQRISQMIVNLSKRGIIKTDESIKGKIRKISINFSHEAFNGGI